jgi:hypothetical protein
VPWELEERSCDNLDEVDDIVKFIIFSMNIGWNYLNWMKTLMDEILLVHIVLRVGDEGEDAMAATLFSFLTSSRRKTKTLNFET